jgi:hypothetical protein
MFKKLFFIALTLILFSSCSQKESYMKDFGEFINEVELANESYSEEDWKYIEVDFNNFSEIRFMEFENQLTEAELKQVESFRKRYKKLKIINDPAKEIGGEIMDFLGI